MGVDNKKAYTYFKDKIGEADEVDEYDGEVDWFHYEDEKGKFCPILDYKRKRWGVDFVIAHSNAYDGSPDDVNLTIQGIKDYCKLLVDKFDVSEDDCRLVSYSWYNGGDEPIHL